MSYVSDIQNSINYIEDNILNNLNYEDIAEVANESSYAYQRIFYVLCGMTLGEYIRGRRLTLAGSELINNNTRIIDLAYKYHYETPESFSRAFKAFHGINPSKVNGNGNYLKSMSPLRIALTLKGGNIMKFRIEKVEGFKVIGKVKSFSSRNNQGFNDIPKFWDNFATEENVAKLCKYSKGSKLDHALLGVCFDDVCNVKYDYAIAVSYNDSKNLDYFDVREIPTQTYLIVKEKGKIPEAMQQVYKEIYSDYLPSSEYVPVSGPMLEIYRNSFESSENYEFEIWIPVNKK